MLKTHVYPASVEIIFGIGVSVCVLVHLTNLQFRVGLTQAPVNAAVTVCLLKQHVQNLSDCLSLIHHQYFGAAVTHQHFYY